MADNASKLKNLWKISNYDVNSIPTLLQNIYLPPPSGNLLGAVKAGTNITIGSDGTISATGGGGSSGVSSFALSGQTLRQGAISINSGNPATLTIVDNGDGSYTFNATGGGGGGGNATITSDWASGGTSKAQYSAPGIVNNQGINMNIVLSSGNTPIFTAITVGGVAVTGTPYTPTGAFPNYTLSIPASAVPNSAQLAGGIVDVTGTIAGGNFFNTGTTLTTLPPVPFAATETGAFLQASYPFYTASDSVVLSGSVTGTATAINVIIGDGTTSQTSAVQNFTTTSPLLFGQAVITGSISGTGTLGAGSTTINLNYAIPSPAKYTPAFYQQTATAAPPTWATTTTQTPGGAAGSTITFPAATSVTQYDWIATTQPASKVFFVTAVGNVPITAEVSTTTTIGSGSLATTFNVFGISPLTVGQSLQIFIGA